MLRPQHHPTFALPEIGSWLTAVERCTGSRGRCKKGNIASYRELGNDVDYEYIYSDGYVVGDFHMFAKPAKDPLECAKFCWDARPQADDADKESQQCVFFQYGRGSCWGFPCGSFDNGCVASNAFGFCMGFVEARGYKLYKFDEFGGCFAEGLFSYTDCCREYGTFGNILCWEGGFNYSQCCAFRFGPRIYGLPIKYLRSQVKLDVGGNAGLVSLQPAPGVSCSSDEDRELNGACNVWLESWYFARLLVEVAGVSRLSVLDVGSGLGLAAVAAAKAGHDVMATELDSEALSAVGANAKLNNVDVGWAQWDVTKPPPKQVSSIQTIDILAYSVSIGQTMAGFMNDSRTACNRATAVVSRLARLPVGVFLFASKFQRDLRTLHPEAEVFMYALRVRGHRAPGPCWTRAEQNRFWRIPLHRSPWASLGTNRPSGCVRKPFISPRGWLEKAGLGPPSTDLLVIW